MDLPHQSSTAAVAAGARLITVPGAGHIVNIDAPDGFNKAVEAFLAGQTAR